MKIKHGWKRGWKRVLLAMLLLLVLITPAFAVGEEFTDGGGGGGGDGSSDAGDYSTYDAVRDALATENPWYIDFVDWVLGW